MPHALVAGEDAADGTGFTLTNRVFDQYETTTEPRDAVVSTAYPPDSLTFVTNVILEPARVPVISQHPPVWKYRPVGCIPFGP